MTLGLPSHAPGLLVPMKKQKHNGVAAQWVRAWVQTQPVAAVSLRLPQAIVHQPVTLSVARPGHGMMPAAEVHCKHRPSKASTSCFLIFGQIMEVGQA